MWRPGLAALLVAASLAVPARAHTGDPNTFTIVDSIEPGLSGVTVEVRVGAADQLLVVNTTDSPVEVLDGAGKAFLRIGPSTVQADYASPDWYASNSPTGLVRPRQRGAKADWRVVSRGGSWGWFDHRMHDGRYAPVTQLETTTRLADWTVPLRHRGRAVTVRGHVEYRPVLGSFATRLGKAPQGVHVELLDGRVPGLFVRWDGSGTLTVRGIEGEPFARIGPKGVELNEASATRHVDVRLRGEEPAVAADPRTPRWELVAAGTRAWSWLDRRLAYAPGVPPPDALRTRQETTLVEWDVPVDVDGVAAHIQGVTVWVPVNASQSGRRGVPWWPLAGSAAGVSIAWLLRRRFAER